MKNKTEYRDNGAIGALLDEYEKAIKELAWILMDLTNEEIQLIVDGNTNDEDCKSIQSVLTHVIQSGYTYAIEVRKWLGEEINYRDKIVLNTTKEYQLALNKMFDFTESLFNDYPKLKVTEFELNRKIRTRWGQIFDVEQLMQHAIVHILRHRRQIEIFKQKIGK